MFTSVLFIVCVVVVGFIVIIVLNLNSQNEWKRKKALAYCSDCNSSWCPCWEQEQARRRTALEKCDKGIENVVRS